MSAKSKRRLEFARRSVRTNSRKKENRYRAKIFFFALEIVCIRFDKRIKNRFGSDFTAVQTLGKSSPAFGQIFCRFGQA